MSSLRNKQIPPPASWEEFEDMCCDLWRLLWDDRNAQKHGRKGQAGQVLFLVEIIEASGFNQQQSCLASLYLSSSPSGVRA